jgi:hypothetical protein
MEGSSHTEINQILVVEPYKLVSKKVRPEKQAPPAGQLRFDLTVWKTCLRLRMELQSKNMLKLLHLRFILVDFGSNSAKITLSHDFSVKIYQDQLI